MKVKKLLAVVLTAAFLMVGGASLSEAASAQPNGPPTNPPYDAHGHTKLPEPSTLILIAAGMGGLALARKVSKK